jgi:hypothetical protein
MRQALQMNSVPGFTMTAIELGAEKEQAVLMSLPMYATMSH